MKTVKRTEIGSFELNMEMYTSTEAKEMLEGNKDIFYINDDFEIITNANNYYGYEKLRINHSACTDIKVIYNKEYGEYKNVVKTKDGNIY